MPNQNNVSVRQRIYYTPYEKKFPDIFCFYMHENLLRDSFVGFQTSKASLRKISEQTDYFALFVHVDIFGGRLFRKPRHRHYIAR